MNDHNASTRPVDVRALARSASARLSVVLFFRDGSELVTLEPGHSVTIGRTIPATLIIADPSLSREHARIQLEDGQVWVQDLGSTNGTWINGSQIDTRKVLQRGDELRLGAVTAALYVHDRSANPPSQIDRYDRFVERVVEEVARAKAFGGPFTVLFIAAQPHRNKHISHWVPFVQARLRPVDRVAAYSPEALLILLPQSDSDDAMALAQAYTGSSSANPPLRVGVASFPSAGSSAHEMLTAARVTCRKATGVKPIGFATRESGSSESVSTQPVFASAAMKELQKTARVIAKSHLPVLIMGETGTGKEVLAHCIHDASDRRSKPFRCLNCGAIPQNLVESTLFGHERGAFTGADRRQLGLFESAEGGTVLLDEIGELPLAAQAALLRTIETKTVRRVGGHDELSVDVRIIAATHRNLEAMASEGSFRPDLFFRLNVLAVHVPALRERPDDIEPLATAFVKQAAREAGKHVQGISDDVLACLRRYTWPGNVRELRNAVDRAVVLVDGACLSAADFPPKIRSASPRPKTTTLSLDALEAVPIREQVRRYEAKLIVAALQDHQWNQTKTAKTLGLSRRALIDKMNAYDIKRPKQS